MSSRGCGDKCTCLPYYYHHKSLFFDNENSVVGLELAKRTLQEVVILPALRPEVSVVLTSSFHMVLNITLVIFHYKIIVVYWTPFSSQGYTFVWTTRKWEDNVGTYTFTYVLLKYT